VTEWLVWFITALMRAVDSAHLTLDSVLQKTNFWQRWAQMPLNERQVAMLNRVLDGFQGRLTSSQWAKLVKCSPDTALRDIQLLVSLGVLRKTESGGRSTAYELVHIERR
jgi:Fic family protein